MVNENIQHIIQSEGLKNLKILFKKYGMETDDEVCCLLLEPLYKIISDILKEAQDLANFTNQSEVTKDHVWHATERIMSNFEHHTPAPLVACQKMGEDVNSLLMIPIKSFSGLRFPNSNNNLTGALCEVKTRKEMADEEAEKSRFSGGSQPQFLTRNINSSSNFTQ